MRAFVIDPNVRTVEAVDIDGSGSVRTLIGFPTVDSDEIDDSGDRHFFDEECFIRSQPGAPRFKVDSLAPVAGKGVIAGSAAGGKQLADAVIEADALRRRATFL